jgi:hypothetical protein
MRRPASVRNSRKYIALTETVASPMMKIRLYGSCKPTITGIPPESHLGDVTSTFAAPNQSRRPCWIIRLTPHVRSSVSSGRPYRNRITPRSSTKPAAPATRNDTGKATRK